MAAASSLWVGGLLRPGCASNSDETRFSFDKNSTTWTGRRISLPWSDTALDTACRIHQCAYVENLNPLVASNLSIAFLKPKRPSGIKSPSSTPFPQYRLAIEITIRRLNSIIRARASSASITARAASCAVSSPAACATSLNDGLCFFSRARFFAASRTDLPRAMMEARCCSCFAVRTGVFPNDTRKLVTAPLELGFAPFARLRPLFDFLFPLSHDLKCIKNSVSFSTHSIYFVPGD
mmetsp:Transcript_3586/g.7305  ORF Transcript_3586/g.7305 Transcript_3586/m.7305 type:complete len:236 (-) Transcript_3586:11-718(-)